MLLVHEMAEPRIRMLTFRVTAAGGGIRWAPGACSGKTVMTQPTCGADVYI